MDQRVRRIESCYAETRHSQRIHDLCQRVAAGEGVSAKELMEDAERLAAEFDLNVGGPATADRLAAYVADRDGWPVEQVIAEMEEIREKYP